MRILRSLFSVYGIMLAGYSAGAIGTFILGRLLQRGEMGQFFLIRNALDIFICLPLLGKDSAFLKFFSHRDVSTYQWKREIRKTMTIAGCLILAATMVFFYTYRLSVWICIGLVVASICGACLLLISIFVRTKHKYVLSALITNASPFLFIISFPAIISISKYRFVVAVGWLFTSCLLSAAISLWLAHSKMPVGSTAPSQSVYRDAWVFFLMSLATIVIDRGGTFVLPRIMSFEQLSTYGMVLGLASVFRLARAALQNVLVPHLTRSAEIPIFKYLVLISASGIILGCVYVMLGPFLLHTMFSGKYDDGLILFPFFAIAGCFEVFSALPSALVGGRSSEKALRQYAVANTAVSLASFVLIFPLALHSGIIGVAVVRIIGWLGETMVGYTVVYRNKERSKYALHDN